MTESVFDRLRELTPRMERLIDSSLDPRVRDQLWEPLVAVAEAARLVDDEHEAGLSAAFGTAEKMHFALAELERAVNEATNM